MVVILGCDGDHEGIGRAGTGVGGLFHTHTIALGNRVQFAGRYSVGLQSGENAL